MSDIKVHAASREYTVRIGAGVRNDIDDFVDESLRNVVLCVDAGLADDPRTKIARSNHSLTVPNGEENKNFASVELLCHEFANLQLQRTDLIVAVGGGVVTDVVGFAASVYNRGIDVIHVPTTLLGQVDAAVGGKTAINIPEGKNLVGSFHQPLAVLCDTDFLTSLPAREWISGLGEVCKCGLVIGHSLKDADTESMITECVQWKADIVSADERESNKRAILNYGHTLAHALESAGVPLTHGEAVGVGLCFAAYLADALDRIDTKRRDAIVAEVASYGLPTTVPSSVDVDTLIDRMSRDKKRRELTADELTFVLDGPKGVEVVSEIPSKLVRDTLKEWLS
jgi:5-deoxy-5-amino-3-dehydroquinate synthase